VRDDCELYGRRAVMAGETVAAIVEAHRAGASPEATVARAYARIRAHADPAIFITLRAEADALAEAKALAGRREADRALAALPLHGVPVAIKDNIDVAGLPTTAACPAFAYTPVKDATCVARFGTRARSSSARPTSINLPPGLSACARPTALRATCSIGADPGGSSTGSAIAVAAGLVPLALGTDTAGSGRVPAALGNLVGLKPSLGLVSTAGVVPACRSIDCVSVLALTVDDAFAALAAIAGPDAADAHSRRRSLGALKDMPRGLRLGVPKPDQRQFFGDDASAAAYDDALGRLARLGAAVVEFDMAPFFEARGSSTTDPGSPSAISPRAR